MKASSATKPDLELLRLDLEAKIEHAKSETIRWIVTLVLAQILAATGSAFAIISRLP